MRNAGLKEKQKEIQQSIKEEERLKADRNMSLMEQIEHQNRIKQQQLKFSLAQEYERSIREKNIK